MVLVGRPEGENLTPMGREGGERQNDKKKRRGEGEESVKTPSL